MDFNPQRDFGTFCLADQWPLQELQKQIEISGVWLHTYLQTYHDLFNQTPQKYSKLESLQLKILTEATFLQKILNEYNAVRKKNKHRFSISSALISKAQDLLYTAQTVILTPIRP